MNHRIWAVTAAAFLVGVVLWSVAESQTPGAVRPIAPPPRTAGPGNIALLDVTYIFEKHPRFKATMDEMKGDVQRAEGEVKKEGETLRALMEKLAGFKGTPDYKKMEEDIAKRDADLKLRIQLQRKEFVQREARIYLNVYREIQDEVDYYCRQNGVDMVLRFSGDPVDVDNPNSVLGFVNKPVVWYDKSRDITPIILDNLRRRGPVENVRRDGPTVPFPQPKPR